MIYSCVLSVVNKRDVTSQCTFLSYSQGVIKLQTYIQQRGKGCSLSFDYFFGYGGEGGGVGVASVVVFFKEVSKPYPTRVILASSDDHVTFVVERARKDVVRVSLQHLQARSCKRVPQPCCLVARAREQPCALRVEDRPANLSL